MEYNIYKQNHYKSLYIVKYFYELNIDINKLHFINFFSVYLYIKLYI